MLKLILFVACLGTALALLQSNRRGVEPFVQAVPQVHMRQISRGNAFLSYTPITQSDDALEIALDLAAQVVGFPFTYTVKSTYETEISKRKYMRHVYLTQTASDGREILNADLNINVVNKRAVNVGHTFFNGSTVAPVGKLSSIEALKNLMVFLKIDSTDSALFVIEQTNSGDLAHKIEGVKGSVSPAIVRAGHVQVEFGKRLEPAWDIQLDMDTNWWNAHVSSRTGEVLALYDWVNDLNEFNVYPPGVNDPDDGERSIVYSPATTASPCGWNDQGNGSSYTTTIGNNVYAQLNPTGGSSWLNNQRTNGGPDLYFNFEIDFTQEPVTYVNASTTNLFAWNNYIHDIFYGYGFTEEAGNFQENNFGLGGLGNDSVIANCQDGSGYNNANFATPPDGQRPRMRMYTWTLSTPDRDGDLEAGIIIHEYAHGISNRLTGGPTRSGCLPSGEPGGMGEGWGDFFATVIRQRSYYTRDQAFSMGAYSSNDPAGIRYYLYSTDMKIDPETYGFINYSNYSGVHPKGEVWCGILWETYWNLVDAYGWSSDLYNGVGGNNKILQLVIDGMKIQPCQPNFVDARDAILTADAHRYGGANYCLLYAGFAKRGLGFKAIGGRVGNTQVVEDFTLPEECQ